MTFAGVLLLVSAVMSVLHSMLIAANPKYPDHYVRYVVVGDVIWTTLCVLAVINLW